MYGKFGDITRYLRTPHSLPNLVTSGQKNKIKKRPKYLESGSQNAKSIQWIPFLLLSRILKILCISSSNISVSVFVATYVIFFYQISFQISHFFEKKLCLTFFKGNVVHRGRAGKLQWTLLDLGIPLSPISCIQHSSLGVPALIVGVGCWADILIGVWVGRRGGTDLLSISRVLWVRGVGDGRQRGG